MTDTVQIALIAAVPAGLAALASWFAALGHAQAKKGNESLVNIKLQLDGRLDELVAATKAQGRLDEQSDNRRDGFCRYDQSGTCKYPEEE